MKPILPLFTLATLCTQLLFSQNALDNAGLAAGTPASVAFSLRKLSSSYTGPAIKVRRSSDNAEANVAFDGSGAVSASSVVTFTPGVVVGSAFGTAQTGTISSDVARTGTITIKTNKTGTIATSNSSSAVTGSGTSFTTELAVGDLLYNSANNVFLGVVASITNNIKLTLTNYATVSLGATGFKTANATVTGFGTNFTGELAAGDRLFNTANAYLGTVTSISSATQLSVNAMDAVSVTAVSYKGSSATITGSGTNFTGFSPGDLLISNNVTLGTILSIATSTSLTLTTRAGAAVNGLAFKWTTGAISFNSFYAGTSVYVNTWYDQSGNNRNAVQLKPGSQALIVNSGVLYTLNGKTSIQFSSAMTSFLETSAVASYLNNTLYTLNNITAEASINPNLQLPTSTTGGNGPGNTILHYGYRNSSQFTIAQYGNDQNFNSAANTSLELHTGVKISTASSQFYKNGISLGVQTSGIPSALTNAGLLHIGYYTPTNSYYNGSVSELTIFPSALGSTDLGNLANNQLAYYAIVSDFWTGAVSTDWNNAGNWSTGVVPTISTPSIVLIPSGKPFYPVVSTATVQANSISIDAGASLTVSGTGVLQLAGTINNLGTCTATSGIIQYIGTANQAIAANTFAGNAVSNLVVNNSAGVTLNGNLSVTGTLTFTNGNLNLNTAVLTIGGAVTNTVAGGLLGGANAGLVVNSSASPNVSFSQASPGSSNSLKSLTINSPGQVVGLANDLVINNGAVLTFTGGNLAIGSATLTIRGPVVNTVSGGLRGSAASNIIVDGTASPTLSFDQTTPGSTNLLNNLTINCAGQTATLGNSVIVASALTISSGTLADGGNQLASTGTINLSGGTFKLGSSTSTTVWPAFSTNTLSAGGTVDYASGVPQTVSAVPVYQNLTISAAGGATAANDLTVNGILTLSAANPSPTAGSLSMNTYTLNMGPAATTVGQGDVTGIVKRTTILPNVTYTMGHQYTSIVFPGTGTLPTQISLKISIGAAPAWAAGAILRQYDLIQTGGSGTKAVISAHYLDTELNGNSENGLVDYSFRVAGSVVTEQGKSSMNTTQNWVGLSNVDVAFFSSSFGNVQLTLGETTITTLTWNGSTSTSWITATNWTPNGGPAPNINLIIPDAATTPNSPSLPATASAGSITIQSGGVVNSDPGAQLTVNNSGLAWANAGIFNAGTSTITFTSPGATIDGATNFNNITINSGAALQMTTNTITRIGGVLTNNGTFQAGALENTVEYNGNNQTIVVPNGSSGSYHNLVISGSGATVLPATALSLLGDLTIDGGITLSGNTISMNGIKAQSINGSAPLTLNNLVINNNAGPVNLNQDLTVAGSLTFTAGQLAIGGNTVTLSGNVINSVSNGITGSGTGNLIINGATSPTVSFDLSVPGVSNSLNNFTINSSGQAPLLGSDLVVNGAMTFTAGKLAINGRTLTLNGSVINTVPAGLQGSSSSNLIIGGGTASPSLSFDQTTPGTTNLLNNFSLNSSGQSASLANPLIIGNRLDLTNGLLTTTAGAPLTLSAAATFTGGSDSSFVNGPLLRNTAGTNAYLFPVGKDPSYRPVSVIPATSGAGGYSVEYFPVQASTGALNTGLTAVATDEYWDVSLVSGPGAQVTLNYRGDNTWTNGNPASSDIIGVAHFNGSSWDAVVGSTIPGNTGSGLTPVTSQVMTSFSPFAFGFGPVTPLPVTLIDFKAIIAGNVVDLTWTTTHESNVEKYEVERSPDGQGFLSVGSVAATGTALTQTYNWPDNAPLAGISFYRLKSVDFDGKFKYSIVLKIDRKAQKGISVYPNPVTGHVLSLSMTGQPRGNYVLLLYGTNAVRVIRSRMAHDGNDGVRSIDLSSVTAPGLYFLEVIAPDGNKQTITLRIY